MVIAKSVIKLLWLLRDALNVLPDIGASLCLIAGPALGMNELHTGRLHWELRF